MKNIFPDLEIPYDFIGRHLRQSKSVDTVCDDLVNEILQFGHLIDPTSNRFEESPDENLQTLYEVFDSIPRERIRTVYDQFKTEKNPNWYDDLLNQLLAEQINKRRAEPETNAFENNDNYQRLLAILPDIDPDYALEIYLEQFENNYSNKFDFNRFLSNLIEKGYPKVTEKLERLRNERWKENLRNPTFDIEEFLKTFPDPLTYFYDQTKKSSESYKNHAFIYLANAFARVSLDWIENILEQNNHRFASALDQLKQEFSNYHMNKRRSDGKHFGVH